MTFTASRRVYGGIRIQGAAGLGSVFLRLKAEVNWYQLFHDMIGDFDEKALASRQKKALKDVALEQAE